MEHPRRSLTSCSAQPPLQGATPAAWQNQFHAARLYGAAPVGYLAGVVRIVESLTCN
jgi:hypothetical protein